MISCNIPTAQQTANFIKNHKAGMYGIVGDPSQGQISDMLDHSKDHIRLHEFQVGANQGDDAVRYTVFDPSTNDFLSTVIKSRVTDRTARAFRRGRTEQEVEAIRNNPNNIIKREYGTVVHRVLQSLGEQYHAHRMGGPAVDLKAIADTAAGEEYPLTKDQVDQLYTGVKEVIDQIWKTQSEIDSTIPPVIKFENVLVDPVRDEAGTMDIIGVFSDSTAAIYDYKTFTPRSVYVRTKAGGGRELISADFIDPSMQEKWKTQLSIYKRMLLTHYGVKDVRSTRVVPIWVDIKGVWDDVNETWDLQKELDQVQMGRAQSEFLRNVVAGYEKTVIAPIDVLIESTYRRIERLKNKAKGLPKDERDILYNQIRELDQSILDLTEDKNIARLLRNIASQTDAVLTSLQDPDTVMDYEELNDAIQVIEAMSKFDLATQEMAETMRKQNVQLYDNIRTTFRADAKTLEALRKSLSLMNERRLEAVLDEVGDTQGKIRKEGADLYMKEDGFFTQLFLPSSDFNNPLVRRAGFIFEQAYEKSRRDLHDIHTRMDLIEEPLREYAKSTGQTITQVYEQMIDPKSGNFYGKMNEQFKADRATAVTNKNYKFFTKYYKLRDKNRFGETYPEWYNRAHAEQLKSLEDSYQWLKSQNGAMYQDRVDREMEIWMKRNNLLTMPDGAPVSPEAWTRKNGWLILSDEALIDYQSKEWKRINAVPAMRNFYNGVNKIIRELRPVVGYGNVATSLFLPKIRAEFIERMSQEGFGYLTDSARGFGEDLRNIFSLREGDTTFGQINESTGKAEKTIPVLFTNPFKDADGKVDIRQQSFDIGRTVRLFAHMAFSYQYLKQSEGEILAIKDILKDVKYFEENESGKKVFNFMHNIATKEKSEGASMTDKVMNNIVDFHLYGVKVQPFQGKPQLTRNLLRAKNYFTLKTLGLGFLPAGASYVAARVNAIFEGSKGVVYTETQWRQATMNQAKEFKRYNAMGYFFGIHSENEVLSTSRVGKKNVIFRDPTYSAKVLQYVNQRALMRPFSYGDERIDNHIANSMALNYGVDQEGNLRRLADLPEGSKSIWERFSVNEKGEVTFDGTENLILQFKRAVRAVQRGIKGTTNSEDIAYAQTDLILNLMMQFKTWMPGVLNERFSDLKYNEIIAAPQWGRYKALLNETEFKNSANTAFNILGTTANTLYFLSKNLLLYNRLGRWVTGKDIKLNDELNQELYKEFQARGGDQRITYADFMKLKRAQIRAMVSELEVLLLFSALIFALGADWDEDGDPLYKDMWVLHKAYQVMNRVKTELTFSYNPFSYSTLVNNPIPLASLAGDAARIINNTLDESGDLLFGEDTKRFGFPFGANKGADKTELFHYSLGIIPGGHQLRKLFNLTEQDEKSIR